MYIFVVYRRITGYENFCKNFNFKEEKVSRSVRYFGHEIDRHKEKIRSN